MRCCHVLLLVLLLCLELCARAVEVTVNPATTYQTIRGWGATAHVPPQVSPALREQIFDEAVNELGLTRLRINIPRQEWESVRNDDGDPYHINWAAFRSPTLDEKITELVLPFKQRVEARGEKFTAYVNPSFFDGGSSGSAPAWLLDNPAEYAEWATAILLHLRDSYNIVPDYYSICNEAGNNNAFTPERLCSIMKELGPRMQALGFTTKFETPECVNANTSWRYLSVLQNDPAIWPYIGVISYHLYGNNAARPQIRDFAHARGLPTAQTEFMGTNFSHLYDDLVLGGVSYWEHYALAGGEGGGNGMYLDINRTGTSFSYYAPARDFRQLTRYVRPGAVRIEATSDDPALRPLAFMKDDRLTVVLWNSATAPKTVMMHRLPTGRYGQSQSVNRQQAQECGVREVDAAGMLTVTVPANTVSTLYPVGEDNLPPVVTSWSVTPEYLTAPVTEAALQVTATDPELSRLTFTWSVDAQPAGAQATLATPNAQRTQVRSLTAPGMYIFSVTVSDGDRQATRTVLVPVFAGNQPPVITDLHNRLPVTVTLPQSSTELRVAGWDLERDPLSYEWSVKAQPPGANAVLETPGAARCKVTGLTGAGEYLFSLTLADAGHASTQQLRVTVHDADVPAVITAITAQPAAVVAEEGKTRLSADITDADNDAVSCWWSLTSGQAGATPTFTTPGLPQTDVSGLTVPGQYVFLLTVFDRVQVVRKEVTVVVK